MPVVSVPGVSEPLCRAPQTVEGTTFIHAQPGRARELATILESMPMSVRKSILTRNLEQLPVLGVHTRMAPHMGTFTLPDRLCAAGAMP